MLDGGSAEDVPPGLEGAVVVVERDALEQEIIDAEGNQDGSEARVHGVAGRGCGVIGGEGDGGELLTIEEDL